MLQRTEIAAAARTWIDTPYRHRASLRGHGADCLGLVRGLYRDLIGAEPLALPVYNLVPRRDEGELIFEAASRALQPAGPEIMCGNILLFRMRPRDPMRHMGVMVSATDMVHAASGRGVKCITLTPWWRRHCSAIFDFPGTING
jgi:NlpC/P60 family putative phage cell wall peptidase